ncbi:hypothetical protein VNI00_017208 [Paramarasmius palmivorus]|uniref:Uncharacterized protein n=1 Tax=Paramarasmius palmivorus TaxID=297713 RepID=A0AAW0B9P2_9AGAR
MIESVVDVKPRVSVRVTPPNVGSSSVQEAEAVPAVPRLSSPEKRRRGSGDDGGLSPSKIRVKDLTLSPRKAVRTGSDDVPEKRTGDSGRKATGARTKGKDVTRSISDKRSQTVSRARKSKDNRSLGKLDQQSKAEAVEIVPDSDSSMISPTVSRVPTPSPASKGKARDVDRVLNRGSSDTEDTLPSPTSVLAPKTKRLPVVQPREEHDPGKNEELGRPGSPAWDIEDMDVDGPSETSKEVGVAGKIAGRFRAVGSLPTAKKTSVPSLGRSSKKERGARDDLWAFKFVWCRVILISSDRAPGVFSTALPVLEDEEDDSAIEDEVTPARSPLLDSERIHPNLLELYASLPWINGLKRAKFIGYTNIEGIFDDFSPVSYACLLDAIEPRVMRSLSFVQYKDFKSPVRVPLFGFNRHWECVQLPRKEGPRSAAFVLTGVSTHSYVSVGREVGQSFVKQLHVRPLENDWPILQCNIGTFLNDAEMHAPGRNNALIFQTKRQGWTARTADREQDPLGSTPYGSPSKQGSSRVSDEATRCAAAEDVDIASVNVLTNGAPPYRTFEEGIPLYDGRTRPGVKGFRFGPDDWESYTDLPLYPYAEVEDQSLVTVVFTLAGFKIGSASCHTVHFNALFAIVLGKVKL